MSRWGAFDVDKGRCGNLERLTEASLVLHIFSLLELEDLFRLRAVCRSWYDAVVSPHFLQQYKPPLDPWAVLRVRSGRPAERDEEVYDDRHFDYGMELESHVELWRPGVAARKVRAFPLGPPASKFLGLCSSNGLACGILMGEQQLGLTLAVGNPILNKWKRLPPAPVASSDLPRPAYLSIFMEAAADPAATASPTSAYQIVVLYEDDEQRLHSLQYDGASGAWQHGPAFTAGSSTGSPLRGYAFYRDVDSVFAAYDPHTRAWSHVVIENPVCDEPEGSPWADWCLTYVGAFRYKGKCYWASLLFGASSLEEFGAAIWEMDDVKSSWVLVSRVLCRDLFGANWCLSEGNKDMRVTLLGDTVFISTFYRKETYGVWPPVAYDFVRSEWYNSCASSNSDDRTALDYDIECSYVVLPSLTAKP